MTSKGALTTSVHIKLYQAIHQVSQRSLRRQNHGLSTFAAFATQNDRILTWKSTPCCCDSAATVPKQEWHATESSANGSFASLIQHLRWPQESKHGIAAEGKHTSSLTFQNVPYITSKTTTNIYQHLLRLSGVLLVEASWANCLDWSTLVTSV